MPKRLVFKPKTVQEQISEKARAYLLNRKKDRSEPIYSVLDRLIAEYRLKDISEISEERDRWRKIAEAYLERALESETKLKRSNQTVLFQSEELEDFIKCQK